MLGPGPYVWGVGLMMAMVGARRPPARDVLHSGAMADVSSRVGLLELLPPGRSPVPPPPPKPPSEIMCLRCLSLKIWEAPQGTC